MNILKSFEDYLIHEKRYSEHTSEAYLSDINLFKEFLVGLEIELVDVARDDIKDYLGSLFDQVNAASLNRKLSSIRHFYLFLTKREVIKKNPAISIVTPRKDGYLPSLLSKEEVMKMIKFPFGKQEKDLRDRAIVEILYSSGIRVGELVNLKIGDVDFKELVVKIFGKGKKERIVPLTDFAKDALENYLFLRVGEKFRDSYIFLNKNHKKITERGVQYIIGKLAKNAGVYRNVTPHMFRHSFASHFLENGMNLRYLQHMLGHTNLSTTEVYTHLSITELQKVYNSSHPGSKVKGEK